jgi:predicted regulator of Ras-like GTPase activity (Roadblock/LC7/MglB family)
MLTSLVERAPGARGAVFCAHDGEHVELAVRDPALSEYDLKVLGAQMAAAWLNLQEHAVEHGAGSVVEMRLGCSGGTLICRSLPDGYYVVLLVAPGPPSAQAAFELQHAAVEISSAL